LFWLHAIGSTDPFFAYVHNLRRNIARAKSCLNDITEETDGQFRNAPDPNTKSIVARWCDAPIRRYGLLAHLGFRLILRVRLDGYGHD
jgi:hypothetical protein